MKLKQPHGTIIPAYNRDYNTAREVRTALERGDTFQMCGPKQSVYCSLANFENGAKLQIRYKKLREVLVYEVGAKAKTKAAKPARARAIAPRPAMTDDQLIDAILGAGTDEAFEDLLRKQVSGEMGPGEMPVVEPWREGHIILVMQRARCTCCNEVYESPISAPFVVYVDRDGRPRQTKAMDFAIPTDLPKRIQYVSCKVPFCPACLNEDGAGDCTQMLLNFNCNGESQDEPETIDEILIQV